MAGREPICEKCGAYPFEITTHDCQGKREAAKERIKELIDHLRDGWDDSSAAEAIDEISVLIDEI